jgi:hypothetical protein
MRAVVGALVDDRRSGYLTLGLAARLDLRTSLLKALAEALQELDRIVAVVEPNVITGDLHAGPGEASMTTTDLSPAYIDEITFRFISEHATRTGTLESGECNLIELVQESDLQLLRDEGYTRIRSVDVKPFDQWYQLFDDVENIEADLKLRGPGDFLGTRQSGLPDFRHADIVEDRWIMEQAKNEAWEIMKNDPELERPEHRELKTVFEPYFKERSSYFGLG